VKKSELIAAIQKEILRHDFGTFVDNPPGVAGRSQSSRTRLLNLQQASQHHDSILGAYRQRCDSAAD